MWYCMDRMGLRGGNGRGDENEGGDDDVLSRDGSRGTCPSYDSNGGDFSDGFDDDMDYDTNPPVSAAVAAVVDADDHGVPTSHLMEPPKGQVGVILLAVGSFSPPTSAHVRLLIAARDTMRASAFVCGAYMSPVSDAYGKPHLAAAAHRIAMCALALRDLPWARVTPWEARQSSYSRTHLVAQHLKDVISHRLPRSRFRVVLVCGADVRAAMQNPRQWHPQSVARLHRVVSFAVKRRSNSPCQQECADEQRKDSPITQLAPKGDVFETLDVDIEPWVGNLSSTVVRYVFFFFFMFVCFCIILSLSLKYLLFFFYHWQ